MDSRGTLANFNARPAVSQQLHSFFKGLTAEQWGLLTSGKPDVTTATMMADVLLNIIGTVTKAFLHSLGGATTVSQHTVKNSLGNTISESFAKALGTDASIQCPSSETLTSLLAQEIADSVQSASPEGQLVHVPPTSRLQRMLLQAYKVCAAFCRKVKSAFTPRKRKERTSPATSEDNDSDDDYCVDTPSSDAVIDLQKNKSIKTIIRELLDRMMAPLWDDIPDSEYEQLQMQNCREIDNIAEEISFAIAEYGDELTTKQRSKKSKKPSLSSKIKSILGNLFLLKQFTTGWVYRLVAQMKKLFNCSKADNNESVRTLEKATRNLFKKTAMRSLLLPPGTDIPHHQVLAFTEALTNLLYAHIVPEPDLISASTKLPVRHAGLLADLRMRVLAFFSLARWFQLYAASDLADKIRDAVLGIESSGKPLAIASVPTCDDSAERAAAQKERNKICIEVLLEQLVTRLFKKAKITWTIASVEDIIKHLLDQTLAKVEGIDFDFSPKTLKNLDKTLCQELCKRWSNASWVLVSLRSDDPALGDCISSLIKDHLMAPPAKKTFMFSFFW